MADSRALQSSDGEMHTIVLTPEQLAELGLQIQYPPVTVVTESIPVQNLEIAACETEPSIPKKMHKLIRLSNIKLNGNSFQLISDYLSNGTTSTPLDGCSAEPDVHTNVINMTVDDVGMIPEKLIPITNIISSKTNVSLINHNGDLITPTDIMKIESEDDNRVKSIKAIPLNGRISKINNTAINGKRKTRINFSNITSEAKCQGNLRTSLTPIPLAPKPPKKILMQADTSNNIGWNKGSSHQTVYVLQTGDKYHSVEKLDGEKLRVVTDAVNSVVAKPENKNNVLFDPVSKTRILYRVLNPEDLNLCNPNEVQEKSSSVKKLVPKKSSKSKVSNQTDAGNQKVVSVTRSGRCVRPPRHRTNGLEKKNSSDREDNDSMDVDTDAFNDDTTNDTTDKTNVRQRIICPFCKKSYHTTRRMARHLSTFPEHAVNQKCMDLLEKYKVENQKRKPVTIDAESQTDFLPNVPLNSDSAQPKCTKKDAMTDGVNINTYREREDRSLFKGLIRILQRASAECRAYVFIRQLALLTVKLRKLLPCLLHRTKNSSACLINEPVGKILDLTPGKYHLDMDAIHCAKIQNGTCKHTQTLIDAIIPDDPSISFNDSWINTKNNECLKNDKNKCSRTSPVEKWTQNVPKRKWIPIGSDNNANESSAGNDQTWMPTNCNMLSNNSTFVQNEEPIKNWDTALHNADNGGDTTTDNSWISNIPKIDLTQDLAESNHIINPTQTNILNPSLHSSKNNRLNFDCKDKLVGLHSNLVFDIGKEIIPMDLKSCDNQSACVNQSTEPENFDFNDSRFDMQLNSDKLNFRAQYNEMKYGRDTLPPFRKIETSKNIPLAVDALSDISSDADKLHLPSDDSILGGNNYPITTESLELSMDAPHRIDSLNPMVDSCKAVTMDSNEDNIHCSDQQLLEGADLNLPISVSNTLNRNESMLSVSETSLDGTRLSLANNQSVLNLLDPLGTDCLSFADSELNPRASQMSLDLQLDLFPFHHP